MKTLIELQTRSKSAQNRASNHPNKVRTFNISGRSQRAPKRKRRNERGGVVCIIEVQESSKSVQKWAGNRRIFMPARQEEQEALGRASEGWMRQGNGWAVGKEGRGQ